MEVTKDGKKKKKKEVKKSSLIKDLPVYEAYDLILNKCAQHGTVIVVGETGSGKSTQIPQYLMERRTFGGRVAVTQPRRVAAMSLAQRVAWERKIGVGGLVGYTVRFDDRTGKKTRLRYMTDGMLLREAMLDPLLKRYSVVVIDEAHERSLGTDILFGIVKRAQRKRLEGRMPLRVVVMSATLDVKSFMDYFSFPTESTFDKPVAIHIHGRQHKVDIFYTNTGQQDYLDAAISTVLQVHQDTGKGDILVFLTGQEEIESCAELLEEKAKRLTSSDQLLVCPMFAALPAAEQLKVFEPAPEGSRKVVLATNIAETSITISGIKYVVDTGMVKAKSYSASTGLELLQVGPISQEQAWQRAGRAGREGPGQCYRLYKEEDFFKLRKRSVPEIRRTELSQVVLQLMVLGIRDILDFDFIQNPPKDAVEQALFHLLALNAIELPSHHETKGEKILPQLTKLGKQMAALPLEPMHAKFLLESQRFKCTNEALSIAAMLSVESPFYTPRNARREANQAHARYTSFDADHLTLLNVFGAALEAKMNQKWCTSNYVKHGTLLKAKRVRKQLEDMLMSRSVNIDANFDIKASCGAESEPILHCLVSSFSLRVAQKVAKDGTPGTRYKTIAEGIEARIHPSSSLSRRDPMPEWVVFNELVLTSNKYLKGVACIDQKWLVELAPMLFQKKNTTTSKKRLVGQNNPKAIKKRNLTMCD
uniref:RNA helicase n=1 Tax=Mucochytrium quahogii TaxID=96639 RepID=A0A7S2W1S0_9STRA|mmetsp:Transcript_17800/g.28815  ORF Transcript_17800/g.28815 Transcript_17800/m.28815 type:complete len:705 (-) Transcript_17800:18-2132(-)